MHVRHHERHRTDRIGWLRAAVLGANDGIVSTASLVVGVAAAHGPPGSVMVAGIAGLVAGAMSMAAGEYVSVRSQADSEQAALDLERAELAADDPGERRELTAIYVGRGLDSALAKQVAEQLMAHDALGAHARDELGISETLNARPIQAAVTSAASFAVGAALPLLAVAAVPAVEPDRWRCPARRSSASRSWAASPRASAAPTRRRARCASRSGARSRWRSRPASARCSARSPERRRADPCPRGEGRAACGLNCHCARGNEKCPVARALLHRTRIAIRAT